MIPEGFTGEGIESEIRYCNGQLLEKLEDIRVAIVAGYIVKAVGEAGTVYVKAGGEAGTVYEREVRFKGACAIVRERGTGL